VLVDLNMPTMDGFKFLELWSAAHRPDAVPAVVLTSMTLGAEQQRQLGKARTILSKSDLSAAALMAAIESAIATETV